MKRVLGVADGARTHDNRNHNPGLYQLSYSHRRGRSIAERFVEQPLRRGLQRAAATAAEAAVSTGGEAGCGVISTLLAAFNEAR